MISAVLGSSSSVAQLLSCLLALCSALIFILLCLRPSWQHGNNGRQQQQQQQQQHDASSAAAAARHAKHQRSSRSQRPASLSLFSSSSSPADRHHQQHSPLLLPIPIRPKSKQSAPLKKQPPSSFSSASTAVPIPALSCPVLVTLTTLPSRIHHIDKCIASLKQQSYPISRILLCLPQHSRREQCGYSIPERLSRDSLVSVLRCDRDDGPLTRITQAVQYAAQQDAFIVSLHDDVVYHPDTVLGLLRHSLAAGGRAALGYAGYRLHGEPWLYSNVRHVRRWEERCMDGVQPETDSGYEEERDAGSSQRRRRSSSSSSFSSRAHRLSSSPVPPHLAQPVSDSPTRQTHASRWPPSPSSSPHFAAVSLFPTEAADVLCSFRAVLFPPGSLPPADVLTSSAASLPSSLFYLDDEFLCALLSSLGVGRRVVLSPLDVCQARLKLKNGRWSGSMTAATAGSAAESSSVSSSSVQMMRRWSEGMEALVQRGWWPGWELEDGSGIAVGKEEKEQTAAGQEADWRDLIVEEDAAQQMETAAADDSSSGSSAAEAAARTAAAERCKGDEREYKEESSGGSIDANKRTTGSGAMTLAHN